jgi:hypothetical protein
LFGSDLTAREGSVRAARLRQNHEVPLASHRIAGRELGCGHCGFGFNGGGESSASVQVNEDGTVIIATGTPTSAARAARWR